MRATECGESEARGQAWIEAVSRCTKIRYKAVPGRASEHKIAKPLWSMHGGVDLAVVR